VRRQLARRLAWIAAWRAQAHAGYISADDLARELAALHEDIQELTARDGRSGDKGGQP
jgi:hypothetical protein